MCRHEEITLPPVPSSVSSARRWATELLTRWSLVAAADDLCLVVSELVGNAVLHGRTVLRVALSVAQGVLELSVRDDNPHAPRPPERGPDESATSGRGLMLVEALSDEWGVAARADGKEVWLRVAAPAGRQHAQRCACEEPAAAQAVRTGSGRRVVRMDAEQLSAGD